MQLRTEIEIDAPVARVWTELTQFERYPEWNPFIVQAEGKLAVEEKLRITLSVPEGNEMTIQPTLLRVEPLAELRWRGQLWFKGLFDGEHYFELVRLSETRTRFIHGENFSGILLRFTVKTLEKTARGFVYMNQALKKRCEETRARAAD